MAKINMIDKQLLEDAFGMQTGYVLDFSDASFKKFFEDFGINIDNPKYFVNGTSKANRLRTFWGIEDNELVAETINAMADMKINKDLSILARGHVSSQAKDIMEARRIQLNKAKEIAGRLSENKTIFRKNATVENNLSLSICPEIFNHIKQYLETGNYFHAVDEAYKIVRQKLEQLTGCERATDVFNPNAESRKFYDVLFGKQPKSYSPEADFYRGIGYLHLAIQFLRNEKAHKPAEELDQNLAVHYITLASLAYKLITNKIVCDNIKG